MQFAGLDFGPNGPFLLLSAPRRRDDSEEQHISKAQRYWALPSVAEHGLREQLTNEIHARPPVAVSAPTRVSHLALLSGEGSVEADRRHVCELCRRFGGAEPGVGANYWQVDLGTFQLNWERHTEFSTCTFFRSEPFTEPFRDRAIDQVPQDWLEALNGEVLVAIHLALEPASAPERSNQELHALFASDYIAGSMVSGGSALVWSDFRLQGDGFSRFLVRDISLGHRQAGRLVQRLLEIETYRMMALLAFPLARSIGGEVTQAEAELGKLTDRLRSSDDDSDRVLLGELTRLSAEVERLAATSNYRFSAARAYYALVQRRIRELREERFGGRAPIHEFMERRLAPAIRTCESTQERLSVLSERVSRAANLLRTRVDVALEQQNRDLLASMNRRAQLQLRLQETVEGLSVVVLSYYLVGLLNYGLKALKQAGAGLDPTLWTGIGLPFVVFGVWFASRRLRHRAMDRDGASDPP
ncbi:MAG: DUF3422 domain-containing protein [Candidatus Competibacterales bacterium]|nr:DUF3422 domain-containing protein [Candidatus Competibacterales bacterium]